MKKKIVIIFILLIIITIFSFLFINKEKNDEKYSYDWVEVKGSTIGQYRLYVNNSKKKHVDGKARITYLNGKSEVVSIPKKGSLYVKKIITKVSNVKRK